MFVGFRFFRLSLKHEFFCSKSQNFNFMKSYFTVYRPRSPPICIGVGRPLLRGGVLPLDRLLLADEILLRELPNWCPLGVGAGRLACNGRIKKLTINFLIVENHKLVSKFACFDFTNTFNCVMKNWFKSTILA